MITVEDFRKRIEKQKQIELQAMNIYIEFAVELEESKSQALFLAISKEEEWHAKICDQIIELLE